MKNCSHLFQAGWVFSQEGELRPGGTVDDVTLDSSYTTYVLKLPVDSLIHLLYVSVTSQISLGT